MLTATQNAYSITPIEGAHRSGERSNHMSHENLGIGKLLTAPQGRDAVHFAIIPLVAAEPLSPGQHVGIKKDNHGIASSQAQHIGIVDPFLTQRLYQGDRFWLFLYMQTVTGMRHAWQHPSFPDEGKEPLTTAVVAPISDSERWLREFAESKDVSYETLMEYAESGEYLCEGGKWEGDYVGENNPFWTHFKNVTGKEGAKHGIFSCSC